MKKIVVATRNKNKIQEIQEILSDYEILSLSDIGFDKEIIEDGDSFLENALIKARAVKTYLNNDYLVLADDSGLCCIGLDGMTGIYSARYSDTHNDSDNRKKLLADIKDKDRKAYFICEIVLLTDEKSYHAFEGRTYGEIIDKEKGNNGFGYDSIFLSDDLKMTFGEATDIEKNKCSHRGRALEKLKNYLQNGSDFDA